MTHLNMTQSKVTNLRCTVKEEVQYKKTSSQFLVGAPKSEAHLCHRSEGPTASNENKGEFLVITRITHVMDKRSYFSHRFLNEVSHTGVNLDNPGNWR